MCKFLQFYSNRQGTTMVAKLQAMFDRADYEKGYALATNTVGADNSEAAKSGDIVKAALQDKITTGKVGSLTVDPQFLDFKALECKWLAGRIRDILKILV